MEVNFDQQRKVEKRRQSVYTKPTDCETDSSFISYTLEAYKNAKSKSFVTGPYNVQQNGSCFNLKYGESHRFIRQQLSLTRGKLCNKNVY